MRTGNERLLDALMERHVHVGKYADGLGDRVAEMVRAGDDELADLVMAEVSRLDGDMTSRAARARLTRLRSSIAGLRAPAWAKVRRTINVELAALAVAESRYLTRSTAEAMPVVIDLDEPSEGDIRGAIAAHLVFGVGIVRWFDRTEARDVERIEQTVRIGMQQGATARDIGARVVGSRAVNGASRAAAANAAANADTLVTAVEAEARRVTAEANPDILGRERFVATLDLSTTEVCRDNDGKVFGVDDGLFPPLHYRCRSVRVPAVFASALGDRPFKRGVIGRDRWNVGRVPAAVDYREWLSRQDEPFRRYAGDRRRVIQSLDELEDARRAA